MLNINQDNKCELFYISDDHKKMMNKYLKRFNMKHPAESFNYGAFCYILGALHRPELLDLCSPDMIRSVDMLQIAESYSKQERNLIRLALHLLCDMWCESLTFRELFDGLDAQHRLLVYGALEVRHAIQIPVNAVPVSLN